MYIEQVPVAVLVNSIFYDLTLVDILAFGASCKYFNNIVDNNLITLLKDRGIPTQTEDITVDIT